jgi:hypothetical protein
MQVAPKPVRDHWRRRTCGHGGEGGRWDTLFTGQRAVNVSHAKIRALGERAMARLEVLAAPAEAPMQRHPHHSFVHAILTLHLSPSSRG